MSVAARAALLASRTRLLPADSGMWRLGGAGGASWTIHVPATTTAAGFARTAAISESAAGWITLAKFESTDSNEGKQPNAGAPALCAR